MNVITEAIITGFIVLLIGLIVVSIMKNLGIAYVEVPKECKEWNKKHAMEISLFLTGVFTHLMCEITGINNAYIKSHSN
jgi:hypothetical protein